MFKRSGAGAVAAMVFAMAMVFGTVMSAAADTETGTLNASNHPLVGWTTADGRGTLKIKAPGASAYFNYGFSDEFRKRSRTVGLEGPWGAEASIFLLKSVTYAHCSPNPV